MAGDWIKVEKASARKPEVLKLARHFGIEPDHAFGILVRFWIWLDDVCVDGVVDGLVDADVDALMSQPGLAAMLKGFGWVHFQDVPPAMVVDNFDRHNGETSKKRALTSERQAKWRAKNVDAPVDATPSTREEKKREEKNIKPKSTPARKRSLPPDFQISERVKSWAAEKGHGSLQAHFEHFVGSAKARGYQYADWDEAFMTAIRADWAKVKSHPVPAGAGLQASHLPAKPIPNEPHTEMPAHVAEQLSSFLKKVRVA